jgi:DNA-binding CsgD family transcriptional regulator
VALGRLRTRRGDPGAEEVLGQALELAERSGTLQRIAPARAALAEWAWVQGDPARADAEAAAALPLAQAHGHAWFIGELALWRFRAGTLAQVPAGCAEPYALELAGRWRDAAGVWQALGCPYEQARALAEGDTDAQRDALALFDTLGARPAADALRRRLRDAGVRGVARGARESTRSHPCGLTAAEMKVLALVCADLRNADIAERLHRSVRTVDHHVAAVLAKLGVESRQEAVRRAEREGWLTQSGQSGAAI